LINLPYDSCLARARKLPLEGKVYGVPSGGLHALALAFGSRPYLSVVERPEDADCFVDDVIDSGKTRDYYVGEYRKPFYALVDKPGEDKDWAFGKWVTFPWERMSNRSGPEENIVRLLQFVGEDPDREGLRETPRRVVTSLQEMTAGYRQHPLDVLKVFTADRCDEMVTLKGVPVVSLCEHHLLPFMGVAHVGYVPRDGMIVGVSKLARLVDVYARRLQVQERLTCQVTQALDDHLNPLGSACVIEATHSCMSCRGVNKGGVMVTSSLTGVFRDDPQARAEFLQLVRG
jgi:GTP cyclohydrolase I